MLYSWLTSTQAKYVKMADDFDKAEDMSTDDIAVDTNLLKSEVQILEEAKGTHIHT